MSDKGKDGEGARSAHGAGELWRELGDDGRGRGVGLPAAEAGGEVTKSVLSLGQ